MLGLENFFANRELIKRRDEGFKAIFGMSLKDFKEAYKQPVINKEILSGLKYPVVQPLDGIGVKALYCRFQVKSTDLDKLKSSALQGYVSLNANSHICNTNREYRLEIGMLHDFSGEVISLVTNDAEVIKRIGCVSLTPPPPWDVFPNAAPLGLGSLQGKMEYWWTEFWNPFWNSLGLSEQTDYLTEHHAKNDWIECIQLHS